MKTSPTFIALDLETTGLSPEKDTIIEIAAIRFHLEENEKTLSAVIDDERSMLVSPGRKLEENIAMITGISDKMLKGKPEWKDIKERVRLFIEDDAVIVGHNVLFDKAMLFTHGIDLGENIVIDTFELSEILSQEAESLNLGFLGKHYGIDLESEHRALDDTKLSIKLFERFLSILQNLDKESFSIWHEAKKHDTTGSIGLLLNILAREDGDFSYTYDFLQEVSSRKNKENALLQLGKKLSENAHKECIDFFGNPDYEMDFIRKEVEKSPIVLMVKNTKNFTCENLFGEPHSLYTQEIFHDAREYISTRILGGFLEKPFWERKEMILLMKLLMWLKNTQTGLLEELKFYGEERSCIELFRAERNEDNKFLRENKERAQASDILITSMMTPIDEELSLGRNLLVRESPFLGEMERKKESIILSFKKLKNFLEPFCSGEIESVTRELLFALNFLEHIISTTPERSQKTPTKNIGDFGETFFIAQEDIWNRGSAWIVKLSRYIEDTFSELSENRAHMSVLEKKYLSLIRKDLSRLHSLIMKKNTQLSIVLTIDSDDTTLSLIPREVSQSLDKRLNIYNHIALLGNGISGTRVKTYMEKEYGDILFKTGEKSDTSQYINFIEPKLSKRKTVILATSLRHLRETAQEMEKLYEKRNIFTQGISGGKGKMLSLFIRTDSPAVLIGLIDTWRDELALWKETDVLVIEKIPFDPPTDPYFLARTAGLKNTFEEYSLPLAIIKVNTLIAKAREGNRMMDIYCKDDRIKLNEWGKTVKEELL